MGEQTTFEMQQTRLDEQLRVKPLWLTLVAKLREELDKYDHSKAGELNFTGRGFARVRVTGDPNMFSILVTPINSLGDVSASVTLVKWDGMQSLSIERVGKIHMEYAVEEPHDELVFKDKAVSTVAREIVSFATEKIDARQST